MRDHMFFLDHPQKSGIFNVGTGRAQTFNDVAAGVLNGFRHLSGKSPADIQTLRNEGRIVYVTFPEALKGKYQSFTQADIGALRRAGYKKAFLTVEEGVGRYIARLAAREGMAGAA